MGYMIKGQDRMVHGGKAGLIRRAHAVDLLSTAVKADVEEG